MKLPRGSRGVRFEISGVVLMAEKVILVSGNAGSRTCKMLWTNSVVFWS